MNGIERSSIVLALMVMVGLTVTGASGTDNRTTVKGSAQQGSEVTASAVAESMLQTEAHLKELLGKVPEASKDAVERAIHATQEGREKAVAALRHVERAAPSAEVKSAAEANAQSDVAVGSTRAHESVDARVAIDASTERSKAALKAALASSDREAREQLRAAMRQLSSDASRTLSALDGLGLGHPGMDAAATIGATTHAGGALQVGVPQH